MVMVMVVAITCYWKCLLKIKKLEYYNSYNKNSNSDK